MEYILTNNYQWFSQTFIYSLEFSHAKGQVCITTPTSTTEWVVCQYATQMSVPWSITPTDWVMKPAICHVTCVKFLTAKTKCMTLVYSQCKYF